MPLRSRVALIVLCVTVLYMGFIFGVQYLVILPSFDAHEKEEAIEDMGRCTEALRREIFHLDSFTYDWSAWDDTYQFIENRNEEYIQSDLAPSVFENNTLNLIYFVNLHGEVIWGEIRDSDHYEPMTLNEFPASSFPESHPLLSHKTLDSSIAGVYMTQKGPMAVASRPIVTSNLEGPIRGSLIMGRFLSEKTIQTLAEQTHVAIDVRPIDGGALSADETKITETITRENPYYILDEDRETLQIFSIFNDIQNHPALLLCADVSRDITQRGRSAIRFALFSIFVGGIIVAMALLMAMQKIVVGPLSRLTQHAIRVGQTSDLHIPLSMKAEGEIGILAREFDRMLSNLAMARQSLLEHSYRSGMTEMASGVLHNIRNMLQPVITRIDALRQKIRSARIAQTGAEIQNLLKETDNQLRAISERAAHIEEIALRQDARDIERAAPGAAFNLPVESVFLDDVTLAAANLLPSNLHDAISIEIDPSLREAGPVLTDRLSLLQVMEILLANAAESVERIGKQRGEVCVRADVDGSNGAEMIHIRITDNGEGIDAESLGHIFDREFSTKVGFPAENYGPASGLSLHWSREIIDVMRGRVYAESEGYGSGACLHLILPRKM